MPKMPCKPFWYEAEVAQQLGLFLFSQLGIYLSGKAKHEYALVSIASAERERSFQLF